MFQLALQSLVIIIACNAFFIYVKNGIMQLPIICKAHKCLSNVLIE